MYNQKFKIPLLLSYISIASVSAAVITPALPQIANQLHLGDSQLSLVVSIFLTGYVLGQLFYGPLANYIGRLRALRAGLLLNLIGIILSFVAALTASYHLFLIGRCISALGAASGLTITYLLMHEILDETESKHAFAYVSTAFTIGIGAAVFLGGVITEHFGWHSCFGLLFLHGLIALVSTYAFTEPKLNNTAQSWQDTVISYANALCSMRLIKYSLLVGLCSSFTYGYSLVAPLYTNNELQLSTQAYGYWNLLNMVAMFASGYISKRLITKLDMEKVLCLALVGFIVSMMWYTSYAFSDHHSALLFFMHSGLVYLFAAMLLGTSSYQASHAFEDKASASGAMSFINMGTAMLSVIAIGHLKLSPLLSLSATLAGILLLIMLISIFLEMRPEKLAISQP